MIQHERFSKDFLKEFKSTCFLWPLRPRIAPAWLWEPSPVPRDLESLPRQLLLFPFQVQMVAKMSTYTRDSHAHAHTQNCHRLPSAAPAHRLAHHTSTDSPVPSSSQASKDCSSQVQAHIDPSRLTSKYILVGAPSTSMAPLPTQHHCSHPSPSHPLHGPPTHQLLHCGKCTHTHGLGQTQTLPSLILPASPYPARHFLTWHSPTNPPPMSFILRLASLLAAKSWFACSFIDIMPARVTTQICFWLLPLLTLIGQVLCVCFPSFPYPIN